MSGPSLNHQANIRPMKASDESPAPNAIPGHFEYNMAFRIRIGWRCGEPAALGHRGGTCAGSLCFFVGGGLWSFAKWAKRAVS